MDIWSIIRIVCCVAVGAGFCMILQRLDRKRIQDEVIKQGLADLRTVSRIYLERYTKAMKFKQKSKAKQAIELNYMMCPDKCDDCLKKKFCPGCPSDYGWADAHVEFNEEDIKNE